MCIGKREYRESEIERTLLSLLPRYYGAVYDLYASSGYIICVCVYIIFHVFLNKKKKKRKIQKSTVQRHDTRMYIIYVGEQKKKKKKGVNTGNLHAAARRSFYTSECTRAAYKTYRVGALLACARVL